MREFFRSWRRKVGVVTLAMACVFMVVWVRSELTYDSVFVNRGKVSYRILTHDSAFTFLRFQSTSREFAFDPLPVWTSTDFGDRKRMPFDDMQGMDIDWRVDCFGFHFGAGLSKDRLKLEPDAYLNIAVVPYWSITIPLTLISLWLLLFKPRSSTRTKTPEPISKKVM